MPNAFFSNVYVLNSSEGAAVDLTPPDQAIVMGIGFWAANTSGEMILTMGQSNQIIHFSYNNMTAVNSGVALVQANFYEYFGGVRFGKMQLPTLTAGTGWIYFG